MGGTKLLCPYCEKHHDRECWYKPISSQKPICPHCEKRHDGECWFIIGACLNYGEIGTDTDNVHINRKLIWPFQSPQHKEPKPCRHIVEKGAIGEP